MTHESEIFDQAGSVNDPVQLDVIGLGELLWDCFPDRRLPGGAPANVAFHAQQLGLGAAVATRVGRDPLGQELQEFLRTQGLRTDLVQVDPEHATSTVTIAPVSATETRYTFLANSAWDHLAATEPWLAAMRAAKAVCFGTLAQRGADSRNAIHECLTAVSGDCLVVYDVNLRPPFYQRSWIEASLGLCRIAKLNDSEVQILGPMLSLRSDSDLGFARELQHRFDLDLVCVTRGGNGAVAVDRDGTSEVPGIEVQVADTVGAGDAFTAGLVWSLLNHKPLQESLTFANRLGALVASRSGAMPQLASEIAALRNGAP